MNNLISIYDEINNKSSIEHSKLNIKTIYHKFDKQKLYQKLLSFKPKQNFINCKFSIKDNRIGFTGCINYAVKKYLEIANSIKTELYTSKQSYYFTYHSIILSQRSIIDPIIHQILSNYILGRRYRKYIQFYALKQSGLKYIQTQYAIIKTKKPHINEINDIQNALSQNNMDILKKYTVSCNGSFSAIDNNPHLEMNNFLNHIQTTKT